MVSCWSLWSGAGGAWRAVTVVRLSALSAKEPAAFLRPLVPSCSLFGLHKSMKMCTWQRSACHPFPIPSLEKKRSLLPSVQWFPSASQHFVKCYRPFLPCHWVCFAEMDVEAAKKCKLFFSSDANSLYWSQ